MTQSYGRLAKGMPVRDTFGAARRSMRLRYAAKPEAWGLMPLE